MKRLLVFLLVFISLFVSCKKQDASSDSSSSESKNVSITATVSEDASLKINIKEEYPLSYDMLMRWINGNGDKLVFTEEDDIVKAIKDSPRLKALAEDLIVSYNNGVSFRNTWIEFSSDEPDLWLSVRKAFVDVTTIKQENGYIFEMRIYDTYDFQQIDTNDGIGSTLNNLGYMAEKMGIGKPYEWETEFTFHFP